MDNGRHGFEQLTSSSVEAHNHNNIPSSESPAISSNPELKDQKKNHGHSHSKKDKSSKYESHHASSRDKYRRSKDRHHKSKSKDRHHEKRDTKKENSGSRHSDKEKKDDKILPQKEPKCQELREKWNDMSVKIFRKIDMPKSESGKMKRSLKFINLFLLNLGSTIGAGCYSMIGLSAASSGPSVIFSFLLTGVACIFTCFPYAEFCHKIPKSGGCYTFVYVSLGEFYAYMAGNFMHLNFGISASAVARSWGSYLGSFLDLCGADVPYELYDLYIMPGVSLNFLSAIPVILFGIIMLFGIEESTKFNNFVAALNIITLTFAIVAGVFWTHSEYYEDFFAGGFSGIFESAGLTFFCYIGYTTVTLFIEETIDANKTVPRALLSSLIFIISFYVVLSLVVVGMASLDALDTNDNLVVAFEENDQDWAAWIINIGALIGLTSTVSASMLGQPRIFFPFAEDGLLCQKLAEVHPKTKVPYFSTIFTIIVATIIALILDLETLGNTISLGCLFQYTLVNLSCLEQRYQTNPSRYKIIVYYIIVMIAALLSGICVQYNAPLVIPGVFWGIIIAIIIAMSYEPQTNIPDGFACPCFPALPLLGIFVNMFIAGTIDWLAWLLFIIYCLIFVVVYFKYSVTHSMMAKTPEEREKILNERKKKELETELKDQKERIKQIKEQEEKLRKDLQTLREENTKKPKERETRGHRSRSRKHRHHSKTRRPKYHSHNPKDKKYQTAYDFQQKEKDKPQYASDYLPDNFESERGGLVPKFHKKYVSEDELAKKSKQKEKEKITRKPSPSSSSKSHHSKNSDVLSSDSDSDFIPSRQPDPRRGKTVSPPRHHSTSSSGEFSSSSSSEVGVISAQDHQEFKSYHKNYMQEKDSSQHEEKDRGRKKGREQRHGHRYHN